MWCNALRIRPVTNRFLSPQRQLSSDRGRQLWLRREARRVCENYLSRIGDATSPLLRSLVAGRTFKEWDDFFSQASTSHPQIERWKPVIGASDFDIALDLLRERGVELEWPLSAAHPERVQDVQRPQPPTWLILYLLCKIDNPSDAKRASLLVLYHLPHASQEWRAALLLVCTFVLAGHDLTVPLKHVIEAMLDLQEGLRDDDYNLLLRLLSKASRSRTIGDLIGPVIATLSSRGFRLDQDTADRLLSASFANGQMALLVVRAMHAQGNLPSPPNIDRLIKLFAKTGWTGKAGRTLKQLRSRNFQEKRGKIATPSQLVHSPSPDEPSMLGEDWYMSAFSSSRSLHAYMQAQSNKLDLETPRVATWRAVLRTASKDRNISSEALLSLRATAKSLDAAIDSDSVLDLIAIAGLLYRREYAIALRLWGELAPRVHKMEEWGITLGVRTLTMVGRPREAFDLMQRFVDPSVFNRVSASVAVVPKVRRRLVTQTVNVFLAALERIGRPDVVFEIWDDIEAIFNVLPDQYTLAILLKAAKMAGRPDTSVRRALVDLGFGRLVRRTRKDSNEAETQELRETCRSLAVAKVRELLSTSAADGDSSMWNEERVGVRALRIAKHILLDNWPELRYVLPPANKYETRDAKPVTRLLLRLRATPQAPLEDPLEIEHTPSEGSNPLWPHPQVMPNDVLFRAYIDLLGIEDRKTDIPLALAWMRHLDVKPSVNTLATALVYWAELTMGAPLVEHYMREQSPYRRLVVWMGEWVGSDNLPGEADIGNHLQRIKAVRERRNER